MFYFITAFAACVLAVTVLRPICLRLGHVDRPGGRKHHLEDTPLCGGGAIVLAFVGVGAVFHWSWAYASLSFGLMGLAVLGMADDRRHVPAWLRLALQVLVVGVGLVALGGLELHRLGRLGGGDAIVLTMWALPFTLFAVIGMINAVNMIDGIDGLAGGFALLVLSIFAFVVPAGGETFHMLCIAIGCVAGFLLFNLRTPWQRRASIFLGDAGSLALGFLLVWFATDLSQPGGGVVLRPIAMVWIFGLPLLDTGYLMLSRLLRGSSPLRADRYHFHHALLKAGMSPGQAAYAWLAVAGFLMLCGLVGDLAHVPAQAMLLLFLSVFGLYCAAMFGVWRRWRASPEAAAESG